MPFRNRISAPVFFLTLAAILLLQACASREDKIARTLRQAESALSEENIEEALDILERGAHALYLDGQSIRIETVAESRGARPWSGTRKQIRKPGEHRRTDGTAHAEEPGGEGR